MATSYTSLLGLALPTTGELQGTWGDTVNNSITSLLDSAVAGTTTLSTDGDVTLTTTTGAANQARQAILLCSGARTALRTITAPAQSKIYTIINATTGGYSVKLVGAGPTTGVTIVAGESAVCAWNGSDFIKISNTGGSASFTNVTVSGTTTLSGLTASTALALNSSKEVVSVTNTGTGNNVLSASPTLTGTVAGASLQLSSLTATRVIYAGTSGLLQDSTNLTFDGTSLTLGGNPTLSAGTANGVLYLNGSKVATSGSALVFDGSQFKTSVSGNTPIVNETTGGTANYLQLKNTGGSAYIGSVSNDMAFYTSGAATEQMRLTSTGLGIGTSSPGGKLEVYAGASGATAFSNGANLIVQNSAAVGMSLLAPDANACRIYFGTASNNRNGLIYSDYNGGAQTLIFGVGSGATGATEKMRLDSSGNLGLGVTPSAWVTSTGFDIASWAGFGQDNNGNAVISANAYYSSAGWRYKNGTLKAAIFGADPSGNFVWKIGGTATAGAVFTPTQAMTLDSSGNLGIGTSSPGSKLDVSTTGDTLTRVISGATNLAYTRFTNGTQTTVIGQENSSGNSLASGTSAYASVFGTNSAYSLQLVTGNIVRATLDSSGNLGIGTSSPGEKLEVNGTALSKSTSGWSVFKTSSTASDRSSVYVSSPTGTVTSTNPEWLIGHRFSAQGPLSIWKFDGSSHQANFLTLDSSGNLGLGVTPSAWWSGRKAFQVGNTVASIAAATSGNAFEFGFNRFLNSSVQETYVANGAAALYTIGAGAHYWYTAPSGNAGDPITFTQAMTLDASGNLLVGDTTNPGGRFYMKGSYARFSDGTYTGLFGKGSDLVVGGGTADLAVRSDGAILFSYGSTERARIDSDGNLLINKTTATTSGAGGYILASGQVSGTRDGGSAGAFRRDTSDGDVVIFLRGGTQVGSVSVTASATAYNTSSDYRLKDNPQPLIGSGAFIDALQPKTWNWKADGSKGVGFIAHEVQVVSPGSVVGEKDAVDEDGKPIMQAMEYGSAEFIANIIAELQSLRARVAQLESN